MKCLRCGYCCTHYNVVIVDNPEKGLTQDNLILHSGNGPCKHLTGKGPGKYNCALHDYPWYKETPCADYTQIEHDSGEECRTGRYVLDNSKITFIL